jgi:protein-disulfide isomerase
MADPAPEQRRAIRTQIIVTVLAVLVITGVGVVSGVRHADQNTSGEAAVRTVRIGNPSASVVISATEDLQCPYCKRFEEQSGQALTQLTEDGTVAVEYHIIAFLDRMSTTSYSSRAANASACVAETDLARWPQWHRLIFTRQPPEHSDGLSDQQLIDIAREAGVRGVDRCITSRKYVRAIAAATKQAWADGLRQTPTVTVDGTRVGAGKVPTTAEITAAVDAARRADSAGPR